MLLKKLMFALDIAVIFIMVYSPALFVPSYFFSDDVGAVAIIGGPTTIEIMTTEKAKWGNFLFPLLVLLIAINLYCLFSYFIKRLKNR